MSSKVPIAMTLRPDSRNAGDSARVRQIASELGLEPTTAGRASLSFRVAQERLEELFGIAPVRLPARPPGGEDYGTPGGYEGLELPVPAALACYVESIAIVAPATRLR